MTEYEAEVSREAWTTAFLAAQRELPDIPKTKTAKIPTKNGGEYSYKYADLPDVLSIARPILNKHGLSVSQSVAGDPNSVAVTTRIYHEAGHVEEFGPLVLPSGGDARAAGSAVTYARRYGLTAALGIASDEDDDGAQARRPQPEREGFDVAGWAADAVKRFEHWDDDRRRAEWKVAIGDLFGGEQPKSEADAEKVIEAMSKLYVAELPDSEAPFE